MKVKKTWMALLLLSLLLFLAAPLGSRMLHAQTSAKKSDEATSILQNTDWDAEEPEATKKEASPIDLQNTDWDAEEPEATKKEASPINLQNTNWDEDTTEGEKTEEVFFAPPPRKEEVELTQGEISFIHWTGGFLFLFYLSGGFLTGYLLRNAGIASKCPPDVLILLHVFWPLEWVLSPFFKKPSAIVIQGG